ncbi:MAG: hypothetical protein E7568_06445 [Ruminococcaceae bacterium]|nr:hypothetical protein [Oscillospiraceae bacterium]
MTKIDIFSGFLGAGKTTLIKKLLGEAFKDEQIVIIENEFGEIGIDSGFLEDAGVKITEMNQGCICCSLVGDFGKALNEVIKTYHPDRILIEPSGVGKLSDVIKAVKELDIKDVTLNSFTTVADAGKVKIYSKNFGEFYNNQIEHAGAIILSRTDNITDQKLEKSVEILREHNKDAVIVATPWDKIDGSAILSAMEQTNTLKQDMDKLHHEHEQELEHEHHHHHDEECDCGCHEHHHEHAHHHEHHHEHGDECDCGCHDHDHEHHHHHADEVFTSFGRETVKKYTSETLETILNSIENDNSYGVILRAKGIVESENGNWLHFDYVPGEISVRNGNAGIIGRLCVIGKDLNEEKLSKIFGI